MQSVCSYQCSIEYANKHLKKKETEKKKTQRKALREFNDSDINILKRLAQKLFNQYIRMRDQDLPCISCGTTNDIQFHAGHYKPAGGFSYLRFNEFNVHKQCSVCNNHKSGNLVPYRVALIKKIGIEIVELLELPNQIKKWSAKELSDIIAVYRLKIKEFKD